jgi:ribosome-associated protein
MAAHEDQSRPGALEFGSGEWIARSDLRFTFSRSSGPGGQAVNKLSTRATLRVAVNAIQGLDDAARDRLRALAGKRLTQDDDILIDAETHRSQLDNKLACIEKFTAMVRSAMKRPKVRRKSKPTRSMIEKRLASKRRTSEKKLLRQTRRARSESE